ncbi:MAG: hypothetical protein ACYC4Q_09000 [Victivallaceae bacterium]
MKIIYSILILIFIVVAVFCFRDFFSASSAQSPAEKDSRLAAGASKAPRKKVETVENPDIAGHGISELLDSNIFEIDRGISPEQRQSSGGGASVPGKDLFTLTGVYKFCGVKGAIIIKRIPSAPRQRNMGFNKNPVAAVKENSIKNFFKLGDEVGHGYTLAVVEDKTVILKKDGEELVLTINDIKDLNEKGAQIPPQTQAMPPLPPPSMQRMDDMRPLP